MDTFVEGISEEDRRKLEGLSRRRRFPRGATLFTEGDRSDWLAVVLSGQVKVFSLTDEGREVVLALLGPGELVGELTAIDGQPRSATAAAVDDVEVLAVPVDAFRAFLETTPRAAVGLIEMLVRRLRAATARQVEIASRDTVTRLARRLVELAEAAGGDSTWLSVTQEQLAAWIGSSREAVSKALKALRDRGWIETQRRRSRVLDLEQLRARAR